MDTMASLTTVRENLMRDSLKTVACFALALCYLIVSTCAVAQFFRTHRRLSKALTKQKLFFTFTALTAMIRLGFMIALPLTKEPLLLSFYQDPFLTIVNNLPGLLFFSTYNLLIAYWADILDRVRNPALRRNAVIHPVFMVANTLIYVIQIALWVVWATMSQPWSYTNPWTVWTLRIQLGLFAFIYFVASLGFLFFGSRLVALLRRVENANGGNSQRGVYNSVVKRRLREVGVLTGICTTAFMLRTGMIIMFFVDLERERLQNKSPGAEGNILFVIFYYVLSEIIPSCLLLYILRELPRRPQTRSVGNTQGMHTPNANAMLTPSRLGAGAGESTPLLSDMSPAVV